jgi:glucose/arabinose dehydrogenase
VLATFPDYGLSYKYGGWHLTRTIVIGGNGKIYVAVGSSCNACEEKEDVRASVLEMDPDGKHQRHFARGLRNAVGLRWVNGRLFATNMGSDHLGLNKPADTMYALAAGTNYGWPYCYQYGVTRFNDPKFNLDGKKLNCRDVPVAFAAFDAHSSPLGFEYFAALEPSAGGRSASIGPLRDFFLVALHGATRKSLQHGYRVVRLSASRAPGDQPEDFIDGFLTAGQINGRPVDLLKFGENGFLLTDDYAGVIYYIYAK